jgi:hypothetical protein
MANHSSYGTASNTADMLTKLKNFLTTTCRWTLWDDGMGQAQPYFVVFSAGESGHEDIYLQFIDDASADRIAVRGGLYWDAATHTLIKPVYSASTTIVTSDASSFTYWMFGSLDRIAVVTRIGSNYYVHYSGLIKRFWSDRIAITQQAALAGSNVVVPVNDASVLSPGKYYYIKDNANIARIQVTATDAVSSPNTVTVASLATGYAAGAKIGEDPQPVAVGYMNMGQCLLLNRSDGYASQSGHVAYVRDFSSYQIQASDPDARYQMVAMFPVFVTSESSGVDELRGELIDLFSIGPGAGVSEDVIDLGTSTYKMFNLTGTSSWVAVRE